jgi:regulator of CtrA degradation
VNTAFNFDAPVSISTRMLKSDIFQGIYAQIMSTVEDTAQYLDGPGRAERRQRGSLGETAYSTSSLALTSYLMQMASEALMLRSIRDGDMSVDSARAEFKKMQTVNRTGLNFEQADRLPQKLKELMQSSIDLRNKLSRFFGQLEEPVFVAAPNTVHAQMSLLTTAFGH